MIAPDKTERLIIMHTAQACPPCEKWKAEVKPIFERAGFEVEVLPPEDSSVGKPWFEIYYGSLEFAYPEFMTVADFNAAVRSFKEVKR